MKRVIELELARIGFDRAELGMCVLRETWNVGLKRGLRIAMMPGEITMALRAVAIRKLNEGCLTPPMLAVARRARQVRHLSPMMDRPLVTVLTPLRTVVNVPQKRRSPRMTADRRERHMACA